MSTSLTLPQTSPSHTHHSSASLSLSTGRSLSPSQLSPLNSSPSSSPSPSPRPRGFGSRHARHASRRTRRARAKASPVPSPPLSPIAPSSPLPASLVDLDTSSKSSLTNLRTSLERITHASTASSVRHAFLKRAGPTPSLASGAAASASTANSSPVEEQLAQAFTLLRAKSEDVRLASEIGTVLIERLEAAEAQLETVTASLEEAQTANKTLQQSQNKAQTDLKDLFRKHHQVEFELTRACEERDDLQRQLARANARSKQRNTLDSNAADLEDELSRALAKLVTAEASTRRLERMVEVHVGERDEAYAELDGTKHELQEAQLKLAELRQESQVAGAIRAALDDPEDVLTKVISLREANAQLQHSLAEAEAEVSRLSALHRKDAHVLSDMQEVVRQYEASAAKVAKQHTAAAQSSGMHRREGSLHLLHMSDEEFDSSSSDEDSDEEHDVVGVSSSFSHVRHMGDSTLSLADELRLSDLVDTAEVATQTAGDYLNLGGMKRSADMDFFLLTLMSLKMNMGPEFMFDQSRSCYALYEEAKGQGIQSHQYHDWIEAQLMRDHIHQSMSRDAPEPEPEPEPESAPTKKKSWLGSFFSSSKE